MSCETLQAIQAELRQAGAESEPSSDTSVPSVGARCGTGRRRRAGGRRGAVDASIAAVGSTRIDHHRAAVARSDVPKRRRSLSSRSRAVRQSLRSSNSRESTHRATSR